jgi:hypothetical protein
MKKLTLTLGIFLSAIFFVNAQDVSKQSAKVLNHITTVCSLTPSQIGLVKPIAEAMVKARIEAKQKYAGNPTELKETNNSISDGFKSNLQGILTPEQMKKFQTDIAKRQAMKPSQSSSSSAPPSKK